MLTKEEKQEKRKSVKFHVSIPNFTLKNCVLPISDYNYHRKLFTKFKTKQRKFKPDDIRKKIKTRFHKSLKNIINENLKIAGSNQFFDFLPQSFISNISRDKNKNIMNLTYKQLLEKDFISDCKIDPHQLIVDKVKYERNLKVLKYLEQNPEISLNSGFHLMCKLSYADILNEYFLSEEFEKSIQKLKEENETEDYIREYINKAKTYVNFFSTKSDSNANLSES